jgi:hypothetical protein
MTQLSPDSASEARPKERGTVAYERLGELNAAFIIASD